MQSVPITIDVVNSNLEQGEVYNIMLLSLSVTCDQLVVFSGSSVFLYLQHWPPLYNWNIVESGVKHHHTNKQTKNIFNRSISNSCCRLGKYTEQSCIWLDGQRWKRSHDMTINRMLLDVSVLLKKKQIKQTSNLKKKQIKQTSNSN